MDYCPVQGESKTFIRLELQKPEISADSVGHVARKEFSYLAELALTGFRATQRNSEIIFNSELGVHILRATGPIWKNKLSLKKLAKHFRHAIAILRE